MASRLGVSQATVLRAVVRGALAPAETTPGGHRRFRLEDVDAMEGAPVPTMRRIPRLISTGAAARLLGLSQHTVIRACKEGRLEADEVTPGGHRRFFEDRIRRLAPHAGELVGTAGAARALGLTVAKLLRAVQRGAVSPAAVTPGGHRRFATADLSCSLLQTDGTGSHHGAAGWAGHGAR